MYVVNRTRSTYLGVDIQLADSFRKRLLGLQAHRQIRFGDGVWLVPCNSIVTFRMRYSIDAIFLDSEGRVVRLVEKIPPGRLVWPVSRARSVIELPAGVVSSSETRVGDDIEFIEDMDNHARGGPLRPSRTGSRDREKVSVPGSD